MAVEQVCVFIADSERAEEAVNLLSQANVALLGQHLSCGEGYSILRLMTSDPETADRQLRVNGFVCTRTEITAVRGENLPEGADYSYSAAGFTVVSAGKEYFENNKLEILTEKEVYNAGV